MEDDLCFGHGGLKLGSVVDKWERERVIYKEFEREEQSDMVQICFWVSCFGVLLKRM